MRSSFLGGSFRSPCYRWTRPSCLRRIPQIRLVNERAGVDPLIRPSLPSALGRKGQTIAVCGCVASAPPLTISDKGRTLVPNRHVPKATLARPEGTPFTFVWCKHPVVACHSFVVWARSFSRGNRLRQLFVRCIGVRRGLESSPGPSPPTCLYLLVVNPAAIVRDRSTPGSGAAAPPL